jgi:hypothetical protein
VPNRIDRRTLEGRQLVEELEQLGEEVAPALTNRPPMSAVLRQANQLQHLPLRSRRTSRFAPLWSRTCVTSISSRPFLG